MADAKKVAAVVGVGAGLRNALARRFAKEYVVALVARGADKLTELPRKSRAKGTGPGGTGRC
jgi:NADP-dependent 3-hydroxy acid dehydrogenase YdfG